MKLFVPPVVAGALIVALTLSGCTPEPSAPADRVEVVRAYISAVGLEEWGSDAEDHFGEAWDMMAEDAVSLCASDADVAAYSAKLSEVDEWAAATFVDAAALACSL